MINSIDVSIWVNKYQEEFKTTVYYFKHFGNEKKLYIVIPFAIKGTI